VAIEGLADSFMAFNTNYHDTGLFGVYGVTDRCALLLDCFEGGACMDGSKMMLSIRN
jgi:hypothetical protein